VIVRSPAFDNGDGDQRVFQRCRSSLRPRARRHSLVSFEIGQQKGRSQEAAPTCDFFGPVRSGEVFTFGRVLGLCLSF
jgi:hypothetical protein